MRYNPTMKRIFLLPIAALAIFAAPISTSLAEDDVMAPPTDIHNTDAAHETVDSGPAGDGGLQDELSIPEDVQGGEVRSYIRKDGAEITEHSVNGKVYMVRVKPAGDFPEYFLYDSDGDGVFERKLPGGYKHISPPMWVIKKF